MAITVTAYSNAVLALTKASMNLATDTFRVILCTTSYVPAPNTDSTYANVSTYEVAAGGGYSTGGIALSGLTDTLSTATVTWSGTGPSWTSATITARYAVIVHQAGASLASTDLLVAYMDLTGGASGSVSSTSGTFAVSFPSGILTVTHTP